MDKDIWQDDAGNTIWCEQCGEEPAQHFGYANLCDDCHTKYGD